MARMIRNNLQKPSRDVDLDNPKSSNLMSEAEAIVETGAGVVGERNQVIHVFEHRKEFEKYRRDQ
jgi:hypothetical protein